MSDDCLEAIRALKASIDEQLVIAERVAAITYPEVVAALADLLRGQMGDK